MTSLGRIAQGFQVVGIPPGIETGMLVTEVQASTLAFLSSFSASPILLRNYSISKVGTQEGRILGQEQASVVWLWNIGVRLISGLLLLNSSSNVDVHS